jgi:hypothetical protein
MKGAAWTKAVREEKTIFASVLADPHIKLRVPAYIKSLKAAQDLVHKPWFSLFDGNGREAACIWPNGNAGIEYAGKDGKRHEAQDIDVSPATGNLLIVEDVGSGAHQDNLVCMTPSGRRLWTVPDVGDSVACITDRVYFLRPKNKLWYNRCYSVRATDGGDLRLEYEETDEKYNLALEKCAHRTLFLLGDANGYTTLRSLAVDGKFYQSDLDAIYHIPCGPGAVRIVLTVGGEWQLRVGDRVLKSSAPGQPIFYEPTTGLLMTRAQATIRGFIGRRQIFQLSGGAISPDPYRLWSTGSLALLTMSPDQAPTLLKVSRCGSVQRSVLGSRPAKIHWRTGSAMSADGTEVPYGFASQVLRPRALLVYMYGAYGMPTGPGDVPSQWAPLLEAGWAIGYAYVRGGGDNGWAWAEAGRRTERIRSIEDAEACVAAMRRRLGVPAARTAIYGRSAGGVLIGTLANRHPAGNLFGMVYGEVPYLDVLQTTTNPALPLTAMEYDEFGDPARRIEDLAFWVKYSPITNVPSGGIPSLKVLCRSGINDTQVFAYEPMKWIRALRGGSAAISQEPKLFGLAEGEGHFYGRDAALQARAEDCAILDSWTWTNNLT